MNIQFLIIPIGCGIMGYFTNWLAIKMLFRPHTSKKIFGISIPFTPGILPKRKKVLAKQVGHSVGNYLLTDIMIKESLMNENLKYNIGKIIDDLYKKVLEDDKVLGYYINKTLHMEGSEMYNSGAKYLKEILYSYLSREKFKKQLSMILKEKIIDIMEKSDASSWVDSNKEVIIKEIMNILDNEINKLKDKKLTLKEIIPENYVLEFRKLVIENTPYVTKNIKKLLEVSEELDNNLKEFTRNVVNDNLGRIVGGLLYNKIYENMKQSIIEYIVKEENQAIIAEKACNIIDGFLSKDVEYIINKSKNINFKDNIIKFISENINLSTNSSFMDICKQVNENFEDNLYYFIHLYISKFIDEEVEDIITKYTEELKVYIYSINIGNLLKSIPYDKIKILKVYIINKSYVIIEKGIDYGIKELDVKSLIENKINDFKAADIEGMIISVTKKELKYITLMGGILGFILGVLLEIIRF